MATELVLLGWGEIWAENCDGWRRKDVLKGYGSDGARGAWVRNRSPGTGSLQPPASSPMTMAIAIATDRRAKTVSSEAMENNGRCDGGLGFEAFSLHVCLAKSSPISGSSTCEAAFPMHSFYSILFIPKLEPGVVGPSEFPRERDFIA